MGKLMYGVFAIVTLLMLSLGALYFSNGDMSFLNRFVPDLIYNNLNTNVLFFLGFISVGVIIAFKGIDADE